MRKCLQKIGLCERLWRIYLINGWYGRAQLTVSNATPGPVVLSCITKQILESNLVRNIPSWSLFQFLSWGFLCSWPKLPQWWIVMWTCKSNKPFLPKLLWSWCFLMGYYCGRPDHVISGRVAIYFVMLGWKKPLTTQSLMSCSVVTWKIMLKKMQRMEAWLVICFRGKFLRILQTFSRSFK